MPEQAVTQMLTALRRGIGTTQLYPPEHPLVESALTEAARTMSVLTEESGGAVLSVFDGALYLNEQLLPHASIEFNALLHGIGGHGIESLTLHHPVSSSDTGDLLALLGGTGQDLPAGGTIVLNDKPFTPVELREAQELSNLRRSYASSLDLLRGVATAVGDDEDFDPEPVVSEVGVLLQQVLSQQGASLLLASTKAHDQYTFFHSINVSILALTVGRALGFGPTEMKILGVGALLHDVGKIKVSPEVIRWPGRLESHQWEEMRIHPQEGAQAILAAVGSGFEVAARVALEHHAGYDFSGYPAVGGRTTLHLFSRIVTVCDIYDAMTTRRSYKRAEPPTRALQVILDGAGKQTDPRLAELFVSTIGIFPPGSLLQFDSGEVVMVVDAHGDGRPTAVLVRTPAGEAVDPQPPEPFEPDRVVGLLLPEEVGIQPAALLERVFGDAA